MKIGKLQPCKSASDYFNKQSFNFENRNNFKNESKINLNSSPAAHLNKSTISFTAMKKSKFEGCDLVAVNMFKAPIEKFNSNDDFQKWCQDKYKKIVLKNFSGLNDKITEERIEILNNWFDYLIGGNCKYSDAEILIILDGITKNLNSGNKRIPLDLDTTVLTETMDEISTNAKNKRDYTANFLNLYEKNFKRIFKFGNIEDNYTGWSIIPSQHNDPNNFLDNVKKLKLFSHQSWCTKNDEAKHYLEQGDFHIYFEKGKPKLVIRYVDNVIYEIQGKNNDFIIPVGYYDILTEHIKGQNIDPVIADNLEITAQKVKYIQELENKIAPRKFSEMTAKEVFSFFEMPYYEDDDGYLILENYSQPNQLKFKDLGINEDMLFKSIKEIKNNACFTDSNVTNLGALEKIGNDANFSRSKNIDLANLKSIGGYANFSFSNIKSLKNLEFIGGSVDFSNSKICDLGKLKEIKGCAIIVESALTKDDFENIDCPSVLQSRFF